jgi:hypothetical protein
MVVHQNQLCVLQAILVTIFCIMWAACSTPQTESQQPAEPESRSDEPLERRPERERKPGKHVVKKSLLKRHIKVPHETSSCSDSAHLGFGTVVEITSFDVPSNIGVTAWIQQNSGLVDSLISRAKNIAGEEAISKYDPSKFSCTRPCEKFPKVTVMTPILDTTPSIHIESWESGSTSISGGGSVTLGKAPEINLTVTEQNNKHEASITVTVVWELHGICDTQKPENKTESGSYNLPNSETSNGCPQRGQWGTSQRWLAFYAHKSLDYDRNKKLEERRGNTYSLSKELAIKLAVRKASSDAAKAFDHLEICPTYCPKTDDIIYIDDPTIDVSPSSRPPNIPPSEKYVKVTITVSADWQAHRYCRK